MAIVCSIGLSLVLGVSFMFSTEYFWGKEDNPNICSINATMTNLTGTIGNIGMLLVTVLVVGLLVAVVFGLSSRGF